MHDGRCRFISDASLNYGFQDEALIKLWNSDLGNIFKNSLKESNLEVSFLEECSDSLPPKYVVDLQGCGEIPIDFNGWFRNRIVPHLIDYQDRPDELTLEDLPDHVVDPYYKREYSDASDSFRDSLQIEPANKHGYKIREDSISPAWSSQMFLPPNPMLSHFHQLKEGWPGTIAAQYTTTTLFTGTGLVGDNVVTTSSFLVKPSQFSCTGLDVNTPAFGIKNSFNTEF